MLFRSALLGLEATPDQINELNAKLGFDRPFLVQYADWFSNVLHGDWGESYFLHQTVTSAIAEYFLPTLSLAVFAQVIALALAIPLGILAAYHRGTTLDRGVKVGIQGACGGVGITFDARDLYQSANWVAGHTQMMLQSHFGGIFYLCRTASKQLVGCG